jgi:hypothetical protein
MTHLTSAKTRRRDSRLDPEKHDEGTMQEEGLDEWKNQQISTKTRIRKSNNFNQQV